MDDFQTFMVYRVLNALFKMKKLVQKWGFQQGRAEDHKLNKK